MPYCSSPRDKLQLSLRLYFCFTMLLRQTRARQALHSMPAGKNNSADRKHDMLICMMLQQQSWVFAYYAKHPSGNAGECSESQNAQQKSNNKQGTDLISEARGYLVVAIHPRAAQQLLPDLRGLRQSVKVALLKPAPLPLSLEVSRYMET